MIKEKIERVEKNETALFIRGKKMPKYFVTFMMFILVVNGILGFFKLLDLIFYGW